MTRAKQSFSFQDQLLPDEHILWEGRPSISFFHYLRLRFGRSMVIIYIVGILFLIGYVNQKLSQPSNMMAILLAGLFIGIGLVVYIPYALFNYYREYRTYGIGVYAITEKRILVSSKSGIASIPINAVHGIVKLDNNNGLGTIQFQAQGSPVLYRIKDADTVYKLLNDLHVKSTS